MRQNCTINELLVCFWRSELSFECDQAYWAEQQKFDDNIYHKLCLIKKKNEM
jgi:hypothetical protein